MANTILALGLFDGNERLRDGGGHNFGRNLRLRIKALTDNAGGSAAGLFKFSIRVFSRARGLPFQHAVLELASKASTTADIETDPVVFTPVQRSRHSFRVMGWTTAGGPNKLPGVKRVRVRLRVAD